MKIQNMKACNYICLILIVIGGLNWGVDGLFEFDFIGWLFGYGSAVSRIAYVIIGIAAVWLLFEWKRFPYPSQKKSVKRTRKVRTARKKK